MDEPEEREPGTMPVDEALEAARLEALRDLGILDTAVETDYDDLTALAASICATPMAAVSLVDAERQWFKSEVGLGVRQTGREVSFCAHAIRTPGEVFIVPDAAADPRFADNPLVTGDPSIRFYAGAPLLTSDGTALGSLCVIDRRPRQLTDEQYAALAVLAQQVSRLAEHRAAQRRLLHLTRDAEAATAGGRVAADRFRRAFTLSASGMLIVDGDGRVTESNDAFAAPLGRVAHEVAGQLLTDLTAPQDAPADRDLARELLDGTSQLVRREKHFLTADGTLVPALVTSCLLPTSGDGTREFLDQVDWLTEQRGAENRLLEAHSALDAIVSVDVVGRVISWNSGATRMFGYERDEVLGRSISLIVPERLIAAHEQGMARLAAGGAPRIMGSTLDLPAVRSDGTEFPVELSMSSWARGGNTYRTAVLRDVTAARRSDQLTALVQHVAGVANDCAQLAEAMSRIVPELGAAGPALAVRGWDSRITALPVASWSAGPPGAAPQAPHGIAAPLQVRVVRAGDEVTLQVPVVLDGQAGGGQQSDPGEQVHGVLELVGGPALAGDQELHGVLLQVSVHLRRVAERARTAAQLTVRSLTDPLTGLANRPRALELLQAEVDRAERDRARAGGRSSAVLFLDLDRFKAINDSLGHSTGDQVLRLVAARLAGLLPARDTLARLGGDEFLVLCTDLPDGLLVESVAQRLLDALAEPFPVGGTQAYLGASIGIVAVTAGSTPETLLRHADIAMYRAKTAGGGYAVFDDEMDVDVRRALQTRTALHQALPRDELVVHYQPIVRPGAAQVLGLEALVRWERPGQGLVAPDAFLPQAEDAGLLGPIGAHVLRAACQQMADWRRSCPALADAYVAVNVAAAQLQLGFPELVTQVLADTGLPSDRLVLEITEGALLQDLSRTSDLLSAVRESGVRIALDDFGTGYSSLSYLRQLPVDILKIDRSFVASLGTSPRADALLDVVLELARTLELCVVAEGVETEQQASALDQRRCHAVQGYLYSRPVPAPRVLAALPV